MTSVLFFPPRSSLAEEFVFAIINYERIAQNSNPANINPVRYFQAFCQATHVCIKRVRRLLSELTQGVFTAIQYASNSNISSNNHIATKALWSKIDQITFFTIFSLPFVSTLAGETSGSIGTFCLVFTRVRRTLVNICMVIKGNIKHIKRALTHEVTHEPRWESCSKCKA